MCVCVVCAYLLVRMCVRMCVGVSTGGENEGEGGREGGREIPWRVCVSLSLSLCGGRWV